jgi:gluconolactonase
MDIMAYPIEGPGKLGAGKVFYSIPGGTRETIGGDGCTVDAKGNLYVAVPPRAAIFVISPEGKPLGQIRFPERVSNCALGGKDGKTLYVTATGGVYAIDVENARSR